MALFKTKQEKADAKVAKAKAAAEADDAKREAAVRKEFEQADAMHVDVRKHAKAAYSAGLNVYQYMAVLSAAKGTVAPMMGAFVQDEQGFTSGALGKLVGGRPLFGPIEHIESAGWRLVDTGYIYQQTHSESRDKLLASGQQVANTGRIVAVYTFRRTNEVQEGTA